MPGGQSAVYEFTLHKEQLDGQRKFEVPDVGRLLRGSCKKFTFQLEACPTTSKLHYQGRLSLFKKTTKHCAAQLFPDTGISLRPTVTENTKGPPFYCLKDQTKVEGPWTEKDFLDPPVLTKQLQLSGILENKYAWQQELMDRTKDFDMRHIHMVICKKGGEGKSLFAECMEYEGKAFEVPPFTSMEDIMQCVMGVPTYTCYLIDMPRAMSKAKLGGFFAGIESLKNGVMYDKRYAFKKRRINRPNIIVFSNKCPKLQYLSRDRWKLWTITKDKRLVVYKCDHKKPKDGRVQEEEEPEQDSVQEDEEEGSDVLSEEERSCEDDSGSGEESD